MQTMQRDPPRAAPASHPPLAAPGSQACDKPAPGRQMPVSGIQSRRGSGRAAPCECPGCGRSPPHGARGRNRTSTSWAAAPVCGWSPCSWRAPVIRLVLRMDLSSRLRGRLKRGEARRHCSAASWSAAAPSTSNKAVAQGLQQHSKSAKTAAQMGAGWRQGKAGEHVHTWQWPAHP
jgi:hypothetical protein